MEMITVTAENVPATGLTEMTVTRDGVVASVKWLDLASGMVTRAVAKTAESAVAGLSPAVIVDCDVTADRYSVTVRAG